MAELRIEAIGGSPGLASGPAHIHHGVLALPQGFHEPMIVPEEERNAEVARFHQALHAAAAQLEQLRATTAERIGDTEAAIFEAQALFLQDPSLLAPVESAIIARGQPAPLAAHHVLSAAARDLALLDDPYLTARASDLRDVEQRLLGHLLHLPAADLGAMSPGSVILARDLTPSETVALRPGLVAGIVLAEGTPTAHAAILARGLGLPLVLGAGAAILPVHPGQTVLLDGTAGTVVVAPDLQERADFQRRLDAQHGTPALAHPGHQLPATTADGRRVRLLANAGSIAEVELALVGGAEGIGLVRTEFLLAALPGDARLPPNEDALAEAYGAILRLMGARPVVVRALDAGGDKPLPFLDFGHEANPFLGWRGIRVLLDRPELLISQTRALLRAAARHGSDVRLLLPMICGPDEFARARALIESACQSELAQLGRPLFIGAMIEVPSAALLADALARHADFFSIGTNDLVQYTLARDRGNPRVSDLARVTHPAVLRLIRMTVDAAHAAGRQVAVCGEAAADPLAMPLLVGLGVDELSVGAGLITDTRQRLRTLRYDRLQALAAESLALSSAEEVISVVTRALGTAD